MTERDQVRGEIRSWVEGTLQESLSASLFPTDGQRLIDDLTELIAADVHKCTSEDEEAKEKGESYVFATSRCARAIAMYRVSHALIELGFDKTEDDQTWLAFAAKTLSESAAGATGIEIHPEAEIGERFRIDHGSGVLIGQQVRIGCDCTLLQEVVLGASGMDARDGGEVTRRHPTIGNNVKIYGRVSVLGPVTIHDHATLGAGCMIRSDVPGGCTVSLINQLQVTSGGGGPDLHDVRWPGENRLDIIGEGLANAVPRFVDSQHRELPDVVSEIVIQGDEVLVLTVSVREPGIEMAEPPRLQLVDTDGEVIVIEAKALYKLWHNCDEIVRPPAAAI